LKDPHVRWVAGGTAEILSMADDKITLRSTHPSPPGSRIEGGVACDRPVTLRVKIHACRKEPDGAFVLEGRALDLTRADRERLAGEISQKDREVQEGRGDGSERQAPDGPPHS
jgi:hypothetical protein